MSRKINIVVMPNGGAMPPRCLNTLLASLYQSLESIKDSVRLWGVSGGIVHLGSGQSVVKELGDELLGNNGSRVAVLRTLRSLPKMEDAERARGLAELERRIDGPIDVLLIIGGNGSFGVADRYRRLRPEMRVLVAPKTIDGDLYAPEVCIGHDSAVHWLTLTAEGFRANMTFYAFTHASASLIVCQGANWGHVAFGVARRMTRHNERGELVPDLPDGLLIPEAVADPLPIDAWVAKIAERIRCVARKRAEGPMLQPVLLIAAEGWLNAIAPDDRAALGIVERPAVNHGGIDYRASEGAWREICRRITAALDIEGAGPVRPYTQGDGERNAPPTERDLLLSRALGTNAAFLAAHKPPSERALLVLPGLGQFVPFERIRESDGEAREARVALTPEVENQWGSVFIR